MEFNKQNIDLLIEKNYQKKEMIKKFVLNPNVDLKKFFLHEDEVVIMERRFICQTYKKLTLNE